MAPKHPHPEYSSEEVLGRVRAEGPISYADLAGTLNKNARSRLRTTVKALEAAGHIKYVTLDERRLYVAVDWVISEELQLKLIHDRCRPVDGCMVWTGTVSPHAGPMVRPEPGAILTPVRRLVWKIKRKAPKFRQVVRMRADCHENCVEYTHMQLGCRGDKLVGKSKSPLHRARVAKAQQARAGKLNWEIVREIRASTDSQRVLAKRYNVVQALISRVKRHTTWREPGGMFTGLIREAA